MNKITITNYRQSLKDVKQGDIVVTEMDVFYIVAKKGLGEELCLINLKTGNLWSSEGTFGRNDLFKDKFQKYTGSILLETL